MRCNRRGLSLENVEHRIALSVNAATSPDLDGELPNDDTRVHISLAASSVSEQAFIATDNSTATARDLGLLTGTVSLQDEYVGRFDPQDVYRFELEAQAYVSIDLRDLTADASLYLLDSENNVISQSELSGTSPESLQLDLQAGEYFVVVSNHSQFSSATYTLDLVSSETPPDGAGNTIETAFDLGELSTSFAIEGHVGGEDTADFFAIQLSDSAYVKFSMTSLIADLDLYIYSSTGELLGGSNAANTSDEIAEGQLAAGTYFVSVVPYETAESSYELLIENVDVTSPEDPGDGGSDGEDPGGEPGTDDGDNSGGGDDNSNGSQPITIDPVPYFGSSLDWGVNSVDAPEAWNAGYTGNGVTIAVIDTGFQLDHVDLQDVFWVNSAEVAGDGIDNDGNGYVDDRIGWDFVQSDSNPTSSISNHATHVSGIIAANRNSIGGTGVAYASRIMPIRVLDDEGSGSTSDVAQGIRYAVDNGADIINLSLGGSTSSPTILSALQYAATNDVFVVAAAGNESAATTAYPARHSASLTNVLSVGAHSSSNQLASFSNLVGSSNAVQVDAPGVSIYNTVIGNGYAYLSGTSMATPYVAGVAALTLSANPHLTSVDLREVLVQGATLQITNSDSIGAVRASNSIELGSTHGSTSEPDVPGGIGATSTISTEDLASEELDPGVIQIQIDFHKPFVSFAHFSDNDSALDANTLETIALEHLTTFQADAFADVEFSPNDLLA